MRGLIGSFASMSVDDIEAAKEFYKTKLGLEYQEMLEPGILMLQCGAGTECMVYQKDNHVPATHTVLNLRVEDIADAMAQLSQKGISFNHDEGTDENGVMAMGETKMAWLNDPAGNFISLIEHAPAGI